MFYSRLRESCSHFGALLFKLEASVRLGYTSVAPTSIACAWNKVCTKKVEADMVINIDFYGDKAKKRDTGTNCRVIQMSNEENKQQFLEMLSASGELPVGLSTFKVFADPFKPKPWYQHLSEFSDDQVQAIEEDTKDQAECSSWHQQRVGRVTGTSAHRVIHTSLEKPSKSLLRDIVQKESRKNLLKTPGIIWGREHEKDEIETYKYALGLTTAYTAPTLINISSDIYKPHTSISIQRAGFRVCREKPYIVVSCDAYVHCVCCGKGVVEVKCPLKWNSDLSVDHWSADKRGHLDTLLSLRTNHSYYTQVQMQMFVCKTTYADFITWTPKQTVIFRVQQDEDFQCQAVDTISRLWARHIYPQLAGTTIPDTELELQESTDSAVSDTEQELQNNYVVSTVIPGRRAEQ
ncbi:uncharacterized protein LOC117538221 isoform X3 [Gymnodraco acuticeps]|uniref:Uncharacterized protein LOC117538221 isoform X3 n=1 Tax=Gymnodraco acuticeps TaxID=8218 RepID=A0A6P8TUB3_GYMAC|nr:uncharacterized protein LOC117538221 isoform X3 [Gymnodraco acuticeps]